MKDFEFPSLLQMFQDPVYIAIGFSVAVIGAAIIFGLDAKRRPDFRRGDATSPIQRLDGLILLSILIPFAISHLLRISDGTWLAGTGSAIIAMSFFALLGAFIAAISRTTVTVLLLAFLMSVFQKSVSSDIYRAHNPPRNTSLGRVRISTADDLPNARFWLNGQEIASLPLEMSVAKLAREAPKGVWKENYPDYDLWLYGNESDAGDQWYGVRYWRKKRPWEHFSVQNPNSRRSGFTGKQGVTVFGVRAFPFYEPGNFHPGSAYSFRDADGMQHIVLGVRTIQWERELKTLADVARLNNYAVDDRWCDAVLSYQSRGWNFFRELVPQERDFRRVMDVLAHRAYRIDEIGSPQEALERLSEIETSAVHRQHYDSRSLEGRAVELIAEATGPANLIAWCRPMIAGSGEPLINYLAHVGGRKWITPPDFRRTSRQIRNAVAGHAIWYLDTQLDERFPDDENELEKWLTPLLLQNSDSISAGIIAGPLWEERQLRRLRKLNEDHGSLPDRPGKGQQQRRLFAEIAQYDSAIGRRFRDDGREKMLERVDELLLGDKSRALNLFSTTNSLHEHLGFFFGQSTDAEQKDLALEGYERLRANMRGLTGDPELQCRLLWTWLLAMWPESTPEMFVDAALGTAKRNIVFPPLDELPPAARFQIFDGIRQAMESELADNSTETIPEGHRDLTSRIHVLKTNIEDLECPGAAELFILREEGRSRKAGPEPLRRRMAFDRYHDDHVERLAEHPDIEFRSAAVAAVRYHPTQRRRNILERLIKDKDPRIREEAAECRRQLNDLKNAPLPHQQMPLQGDGLTTEHR